MDYQGLFIALIVLLSLASSLMYILPIIIRTGKNVDIVYKKQLQELFRHATGILTTVIAILSVIYIFMKYVK